MTPKHPEIEVQLSAEDGNAMMVIGSVRKAMRRGGLSDEEIAAFSSEAMAGDYDNVIQTAMRFVTVH